MVEEFLNLTFLKDTRPFLFIKLAAFQRFIMWHYGAFVFNLIQVSEYPKSGASWFCQMLSQVSDIDFPRNKKPPLKSHIMHSHYPYSRGLNKPIVIIRDGRDLVVSAYYHFLIPHDKNPPFLLSAWRKLLPFDDYSDIRKNLPDFIACFFKNYRVGGRSVSWSKYINSYDNKENVLFVKYEDLLSCPERELERALHHLNFQNIEMKKISEAIDRNAFLVQSGRESGKEDSSSFLRKGVEGDWKSKFTQTSCQIFDHFAGETLIKLGYEKDHNWY